MVKKYHMIKVLCSWEEVNEGASSEETQLGWVGWLPCWYSEYRETY